MPSSSVFTATTPVLTPANGLSERLNSGSSNDTAEDVFRKHFNPGIESFEPGWDALIKGISAGDQINFDNGHNAIDQLFIHSASGIYLDRRVADQGIVRPDVVGIGDDTYRRLAIKITTKKIVTQSLLEAMEVYYGTNATRANLTCVDEPYPLGDGWELLLSLDSADAITVPFVLADFTNINIAKAKEVAAVITRWLQANGSQGYALEIINPVTGLNTVRIYSGALGLESAVQIRGGRAQNSLFFPTLLTRTQVAQNWAVSLPSPGTVRFLVSGASSTDLSLVWAGDYVNIYGANFNAANQGSFVVRNVDVRYVAGVLTQYFEILLDGGVTQATVAQLTTSDMLFFRPRKTTVNDNGARAVVVSQNTPGEVNVQLPATTIAVSRTAKSGAYANTQTAVAISTVVRQSSGSALVTTTGSHGLAVGGQIFLDGIVAANTEPAFTAGNGTTTTDASLITKVSSVAAPGSGLAAHGMKSLLLANGDVFMCGGIKTVAGVVISLVDSSQRLRVATPAVLTDGSTQYNYSWVATANMPVAKKDHALSLMTDSLQADNVLQSGGRSLAAALGTSYLYNPTANTWSANLAMITTRYSHTQVGLADGRVLASGGYATLGGTSTAASEIFVPNNTTGGTWIAGAAMNLARAEHTATRLANGKVLVVGGYTDTGTIQTERCELWDPTTETWTFSSPMTYQRAGHRAVLLPSGKVFVWGGKGKLPSDSVSAVLATAEIYDPTSGRWYPIPSNFNRTAAVTDTPDDIAYIPALNQIIVAGRAIGRIGRFDVAKGVWLPSLGRLDTTTDPVLFSTMTALSAYPLVVFGGGIPADQQNSILGGRIYMPASETLSGGGLNDRMMAVATVPSASTFTVTTPDYLGYLGNAALDATVLSAKQLPSAVNVPGPYIYNPIGGFAITSTTTLTTTPIYSGTKYKHIAVTVTEATAFPDQEGWIVFGFGTAQETGPIKYVGREDANTLILDYATRFTTDLPTGTSITLLKDKSPFVPDDPVSVGSLYLTDSSSGRVAASKTLDDIVAGGITLTKTIVYPGDGGIGAASFPVIGQKISDKVEVWSGSDIDTETLTARGVP